MATAYRVFPARAEQVAHARRFIAGTLTGLAAAEDAVLCVSELASNAIQHSKSRQPGGELAIRAAVSRTGVLRVEVDDQGGPWAPQAGADDRGRGFVIVGAVATRWGITGDDAGRIAWFEVDPDGTIR